MRTTFTRIGLLVFWGVLAAVSRLAAQPCTIALSSVVTDETCPGFYDGSIDLTVAGAIGMSNYTWSNGAVTQDLVSITSGIYSVSVIDANGCVALDTFVITDAHGITVSLGNDTTLCNITNYLLTPITTGATFYFWQDASQQPTYLANGPGGYSVYVANSFGCYDDDTLFLSQYPILNASAESTQPGCGAATTGALDLTMTGGTPPFNYAWSNGSNNEDLVGLGVGSYMVTVSDANNCTALTNGIILPKVQLSQFSTDDSLACSTAPINFRSHSYGFLVDGINDYIEIPDTPLVRPGPQFSLEAWIKPSSASGAAQVIVEKRMASGDGISIIYDPATRLITARQQDGPFFAMLTSSAILQIGIWSHIAFVVDGTFSKLYINGVLDQSLLYSDGHNVVPGTPWTIGGGPNRVTFNGLIDEVRLWNLVLTPQQVVELNQRPMPPGLLNMSFYFNFDQAPGTATATDHSVNALQGTFVNANLQTAWTPSNPMRLDFLWNFGDGSFNNSQIPTHGYQQLTDILANVVLTVTTSQGCESKDTLVLPVHTPGNPNILLSRDYPFCIMDSVYLTLPSTYNTYLWSDGSTNDSLLATASGLYTVVADDGAGCVHTDSLQLTFFPASVPQPVVTPAGTTTICEGDTATLSVGLGYSTYLWSNGATTHTILLTDSGAFTVYVTNGFGCHRTSDTATVVVLAAPLATITASNDTLYASAGNGYQWYENLVPIQGAITSHYVPLHSGSYTVRVDVGAGCDALSDPFTFLVGIGDPASLGALTIFPNPTAATCYLQLDLARSENVSLVITDLQGRVLWTDARRMLQGQNQLELPTGMLAAGTYLLKVQGNGSPLLRMISKL